MNDVCRDKEDTLITINNYIKVKSLEEAYELNQKKANRIVGGMMWLRMSKGRMQTAIDLSAWA